MNGICGAPENNTQDLESEYNSLNKHGDFFVENSMARAEQRIMLLRRVAGKLSENLGIIVNGQMINKLDLIFQHLDFLQLNEAVIELESLPINATRWLTIVDALTVHETYFFRDNPQLAMLHKILLPKLIAQAATKSLPKLRIWSAGCSTGEEVYTVAMLVLDALLAAGYAFGSPQSGIIPMPGWDVQVIGTDISEITLDKARQADYADVTMGPFRCMEQHWYNWFDEKPATSVKDQRLLRPKGFVRKITHFERQNILDAATGLSQYDLILCRNVLIYFDDYKKQIIQRHFVDALRHHGMMILGATDPLYSQKEMGQRWKKDLVYYVKH